MAARGKRKSLWAPKEDGRLGAELSRKNPGSDLGHVNPVEDAATARPILPKCPQTRPSRQELRAARYVSQFIACRRHPDRRAKRSDFVGRGMRRCSSCSHHHPDGRLRETFKRHLRNYARRNRERRREYLRFIGRSGYVARCIRETKF